MKKNFNNIMTGVAVVLITGVLYLLLDMRDFMKYKQPEKDRMQDTTIVNMKKTNDRDRSYYNENFRSLNKRCDKNDDNYIKIIEKINKIDRKIDKINPEPKLTVTK